jgi:RNA polymerase sigma-70 factor, ECF subfamily
MSSDVTGLLHSLRTSTGDADDITARLSELMRRERDGHTLQPTAVLHEAFVRLVGQTGHAWEDRSHFLGVATRLMRQVLVDHARKRHAAKRGSDGVRVTLDEQLAGGGGPSLDILALDQALERYERLDPRGAQVAELRVFCGLTVPETAAHLGVSARTVDGDWAVARMWLARELTSHPLSGRSSAPRTG